MTNIELADLADRIKKGDELAFVELYSQLWKPFSYIATRRLNNPEEAMDVVQETFITIHAELHKLKNNMAFSAWMNRILYIKCADTLGRKLKNPILSIEEISDTVFVDNEGCIPEDWLLEKERREYMFDLVSSLPEEQKTAIVLYYYSHMPVKDIAVVLDTTDNAVMIKLSRARRTLKDKIKQLITADDCVYSMAPLSILSKFLLADANNICTEAMKNMIWQKIQLSINATPVLTNSGKPKYKLLNSAPAKVGVGLLAASTVAAVSLGIVLANPKNSVLNNTVTSSTIVTSDSIHSETATLTASKVVLAKGTLPWFLGTADADHIISMSDILGDNRNSELMDIVNRNHIQLEKYYYGPDKSMYVLYSLVKDNYILVLCEYYNAKQYEWSLRYQVYDVDYMLPTDEGIKNWFDSN